MTNARTLLDASWAEIQNRFIDTLRTVAQGGSAGAWRSGLRTIAGTDFINASTGNRYRGAFNRSILSARLGSRLDRRVATARQLEKMGYPDPAAWGLATQATILAPIALRVAKEEEGEEEDRRVVFRPADLFSIDALRSFIAPDGARPWEGLPAFVELPKAEWTAAHEEGVLSLIPALVAAFGARYEVGFYKSPHVSFENGEAIIRMPDAAQQQDDSESTLLVNRLSSFFHEAAHWTGFGGAGEALRRKMNGGHGSLDYAREELVAELTATRMLLLVGLSESEGFLAKKQAYVGGWAAPLLAQDADGAKLLKGVLEDVEKIVERMVEALSDNPCFAARLEAIRAAEEANRIPDSDEPVDTLIPDWRDARGLEALTPAQLERARSSFEAKRAKRAASAMGTFEDYVLHAQGKRAKKGAGEAKAA